MEIGAKIKDSLRETVGVTVSLSEGAACEVAAGADDIEVRYRSFAAAHASFIDDRNWFGVNLSQGKGCPVFKIYVPHGPCEHWLLRCVEGLGMSAYSETSTNSGEPSVRRLTIKLRNKSSDNIERLYRALLDRCPWLSRVYDELRALGGMPVCDCEQPKKSALYFVGANSVHGSDVLKFYFLTRVCADVERISYKASRNDRLFGDYLRGVQGFSRLLDRTEPLLAGDTHLWMVAADVAETGIIKRKIYVDGTSNVVLLRLADSLGSEEAGAGLTDDLRKLVSWQETFHPALRQKGFALCEASDGRLSVNMYYREPDTGAL